MKKNVLKYVGGILVLGGVFFAGTITSANTNWEGQLYIENRDEIRTTIDEKTIELISQIETQLPALIDAKLKDELTPEMEALIAELEAYFDAKLEDITQTEQYINLIEGLRRDATTIISKAKEQIDAAFSNAN